MPTPDDRTTIIRTEDPCQQTVLAIHRDLTAAPYHLSEASRVLLDTTIADLKHQATQLARRDGCTRVVVLDDKHNLLADWEVVR